MEKNWNDIIGEIREYSLRQHYNLVFKLLFNNVLLTDERFDVRAGISTLGTGERILLSAASAITRGSAGRDGVFGGRCGLCRGLAQAAADHQASAGHDDSDDFVHCAIASGNIALDLHLSLARSVVAVAPDNRSCSFETGRGCLQAHRDW